MSHPRKPRTRSIEHQEAAESAAWDTGFEVGFIEGRETMAYDLGLKHGREQGAAVTECTAYAEAMPTRRRAVHGNTNRMTPLTPLMNCSMSRTSNGPKDTPMMTAREWTIAMVGGIICMASSLILGSCVSMAIEPWGTIIWVSAVVGGAMALHAILAQVTGNVIDRSPSTQEPCDDRGVPEDHSGWQAQTPSFRRGKRHGRRRQLSHHLKIGDNPPWTRIRQPHRTPEAGRELDNHLVVVRDVRANEPRAAGPDVHFVRRPRPQGIDATRIDIPVFGQGQPNRRLGIRYRL